MALAAFLGRSISTSPDLRHFARGLTSLVPDGNSRCLVGTARKGISSQGGFFMLVLSRKRNERICIGSDIELTVLSISGGHVRIGIDAPRAVSIRRMELLERDKSAASGQLPAPVCPALSESLGSPCLSENGAVLASYT
jgi:carbon storage regulator